MSKIEYFRIILDKANPIYSCGEKITGCLKLSLNDTLKLKSIFIILNGCGTVYWYFIHDLVVFFLLNLFLQNYLGIKKLAKAIISIRFII